LIYSTGVIFWYRDNPPNARFTNEREQRDFSSMRDNDAKMFPAEDPYPNGNFDAGIKDSRMVQEQGYPSMNKVSAGRNFSSGNPSVNNSIENKNLPFKMNRHPRVLNQQSEFI